MGCGVIDSGAHSVARVYSIGRKIARQTRRLATAQLFDYHHCQKNNRNKGKPMPGPQPYRVSAYNTSKQSENKIHDDTVARRFGFSGGLVPGVDVMAYMMHLPVEKWGRAFLERGLIDARFVKPVYDGEIAEVTGVESNGALAIEVHSRGELCATGSASLPATAPAIIARRFRRGRGGCRAQAGQCVVVRNRKVARHAAARLGRRGGRGISGGYPRDRSDLLAREVSAIPACCRK